MFIRFLRRSVVLFILAEGGGGLSGCGMTSLAGLGEINYDIGGVDGIPHTLIVVTGPDGIEHEYGYGPVNGGSLSGLGKVFETGAHTKGDEHEFKASSSNYDISLDQYNALMRFIESTR
ncbi:MAG TPA: hypothetical protein ACQGQH_01205 [Xylella sp.]